MTGLIVNADDFGLTLATSRAIEAAHRHGLVTSTSVLAVAPDAARSLELLDAPDLDVGLHVALVGEDPPLLSAAEVPTLVDRRGRLARSWRVLLARARGVDPADVDREVRAQLERVRSAGRPLTHLDAHQHVQLLPVVGDALVRAAAAHGIGWVRVPWPRPGGPRAAALARRSRRLAAAVAAAGLRSADAFAGIEVAGRATAPALRAELARLGRSGAAVAELNVHPGAAVDPARARYRWRYRWAEEADALADPDVAAAAHAAGLVPSARGDLPAGPGGAGRGMLGP